MMLWKSVCVLACMAVGAAAQVGSVVDPISNKTIEKTPTVFTPLIELLALEALWDATHPEGGAGWYTDVNWVRREVTFFDDPCANRWYGVVCSDDGFITGINLSNNNLVGTIPPELGDLESLRNLDLNGNQLHGTIPDTLGLLHLDVLRLGSNNLEGVVPATLGTQVNLTNLRLSNNNLTGPLPQELGDMTALKYAYFENNAITGEIPATLGNNLNLSRLLLSNNSLSGAIPDDLQNLQQLEYLLMNDNNLEGELPLHLGNLISLKHLYVHNNQLNGTIPQHLDQIPDLQRFYAWGNAFDRRYSPEAFNLGTVWDVQQFEGRNARRRMVSHNDFGFF